MSSHTAFEQRVQRHIRQLEASGLRRRLQPSSGIDLSSNDYLGLATHSLLKEKMAEAVLAEGCGAKASRLLSGDRACFTRLEQRFAEFKKTEASIYFGSGYAANLGVLATFIERTDLVFCDELNHASIIDGIRLSRAKRIKFPHCNVERLAQLLRKAPSNIQKFLVTESLFSMDGDFAPLDKYAELCRETGTILLVDEAHAVGIYGRRGSGLVEQTGTEDAVLVSVNTAGKALGVAGAFVAGPEWAIDYLIQRARPFIFSTAPPPAVAAALEASLSVIDNEPERRNRLLKRSALLREILTEARIDIRASSSQIIPIVIGENDRTCQVAAELQKEGFDVRAIRAPAVPAGTARLRISVNIQLDDSTIRLFASTAQRILTRLMPCAAVCL